MRAALPVAAAARMRAVVEQPALASLLQAARYGERGPRALEIVARDGRLLWSTSSAALGSPVAPAVFEALAQVSAGQARLLPPAETGDISLVEAASANSLQRLWFAAPLRDAQGTAIAALAIGARPAVPWSTDSAGSAGSPAADAAAAAVSFDAQGRYLTTTVSPDVEPSAPVRAALAARAQQAATSPLEGALVQPYRDAAGHERIGAWRWLPEHEIGVAVEVDPDVAYSPAQYLRLAMQLLFSMLVIAVAVTLASTLSLAGLLRQSRRLGPYRLEGVIEEGGMATVYRAVHALMKRPTAVKILKPHLATDELIARFEREVMLTSRLEHPATVEIYDYGLTRDGTFYFAMEYVDGLTLEKLVELDGPQPAARVAHILKQVCESLREAHAKGLVHRDVKPPNIMLCERGGEPDVVKVLDWGLIKDVRVVEQRNLTQYVRVLGTPDYMPPERVRDPARADARVDIYGVGAVAYYLLTGQRLFEAPNAFELQRMIVEADAPRVAAGTAAAVPPSLDELIARCLAKEPARRPASVTELITVFTEILRADAWTPAQGPPGGRPTRSRRRRRLPRAPCHEHRRQAAQGRSVPRAR
jgi:serine/threonine-protein kinase